MVAIISDDREVEKALAKLAGSVEALGGVFGPRVAFESRNGDIRVISDLPPDSRDILFTIPKPAFLPLTDIAFALKGDDLVLAAGYGKLGKERRVLLDTMLEIYNHTGKIAKYKAMSPRMAFRDDQETVKRLIAGRAGTPVAQDFLDVIASDDPDPLVIEFFFRTRNFSQGGEKRQIIPFIDFTNHHPLAPPFRDKSGPPFTKSLVNAKPVAGSDECFARYGRWDALDTYLMFGFSAEPVLFVRSIPCRVALAGGGALKINAKMAAPRRTVQIAPENQDLRAFMPARVVQTGETLELSSLNIPGPGAPLALKRVLAMLVRRLKPDLPMEELRDAVVAAEHQIIAANQAFYSALGDYLDSLAGRYAKTPACDAAHTMIRIQLAALAAYRDFSAGK